MGEEGVEMGGYRKRAGGEMLYWLLVVLTAGILWLVCRWYPSILLRIMYTPCPLSRASLIAIRRPWDAQNPIDLCSVESLLLDRDVGVVLGEELLLSSEQKGASLYSQETLTTLFYRFLRYGYHPASDSFAPIQFEVEKNRLSYRDVHLKYGHPITEDDMTARREIYGANEIVVPLPSIPSLLVNEVLHPFYIFQAFSVALWFYEDYTVYSVAILVTSIASAVWNLVETRNNILRLRDLAHANQSAELNVLMCGPGGQGRWEARRIGELVPGCVVEIVDNMEVCCDMILLNGHCVINESMLTGESIPIPKAPLPISESHTIYNAEKDQTHTLFSGTKVVQIRPPSGVTHGKDFKKEIDGAEDPGKTTDLGNRVCGLVLRTGFCTSKGELVRAMLYPRPHKFRFYEDSFKFIGVLSLMAFLGFLYSIYLGIYFGSDVVDMIVKGLDLVTVVIPPALPVAMTVGISFALDRLKSQQVFCTSPPRINIAGKLNLICFDKTGTLTESDLGVLGVIPSIKGEFDLPISSNVPHTSSVFLQCLVSCHSLARIGSDLVGDPLEVKMFEATHWAFDDSHAHPSPSALYEILAIVTPDFDKYSNPLHLEHSPESGHPPDSPDSSDSDSDDSDVGEEGGGDEEKGRLEERREAEASRNRSYSHTRRMSANTHAEDERRVTEKVIYTPSRDSAVWILRRFGFSASLQRMSVIVTTPQAAPKDPLILFCKGSPEMIASLCAPASLPPNFQDVLLDYVQKGYRVLGCATRPLPPLSPVEIQTASRKDLECDLTFLGFLIMQNKLKDDTADIIRLLVSADFRTVMITGDNALTALAIGRECNMVPRGVPLYVSDAKLNENGETSIVWKSADEIDPVEYSTEEFFDPILRHYMSRCRSLQRADAGADAEGDGNEEAPLLRFKESGGSSRVNGHSNSPLDPSKSYALGVTGPAFSLLVPDRVEESQTEDLAQLYLREGKASPSLLLHLLLHQGAVFARMKPEQKALLVEHMIAMGYTTAMVGDGANDCQSLKAAEVGLSLSEAEASIAASFTSKLNSISSVVNLLREGRCALVTSFQCFKFMALYSVIQFATVICCYYVNAMLSNFQYLYIDLFIILPVAFTMGRTHPTRRLPSESPTAALISKRVLLSVLGQSAIQIGFQVFVFYLLTCHTWYYPLLGRTDMINKLSMEGTAVFVASLHQYVSVCIAFSISKPFRRPIHTNRIFLVYLICVTICNVYVTLFPSEWVRDQLALTYMPFTFRLTILVVALCNFIVTFYFERVMVLTFLNAFKRWRAARKKRPMKPYKWLEKYSLSPHHSSKRFLSEY